MHGVLIANQPFEGLGIDLVVWQFHGVLTLNGRRNEPEVTRLTPSREAQGAGGRGLAGVSQSARMSLGARGDKRPFRAYSVGVRPLDDDQPTVIGTEHVDGESQVQPDFNAAEVDHLI
jgi:hypothetical protein